MKDIELIEITRCIDCPHLKRYDFITPMMLFDEDEKIVFEKRSICQRLNIAFNGDLVLRSNGCSFAKIKGQNFKD